MSERVLIERPFVFSWPTGFFGSATRRLEHPRPPTFSWHVEPEHRHRTPSATCLDACVCAARARHQQLIIRCPHFSCIPPPRSRQPRPTAPPRSSSRSYSSKRLHPRPTLIVFKSLAPDVNEARRAQPIAVVITVRGRQHGPMLGR